MNMKTTKTVAALGVAGVLLVSLTGCQNAVQNAAVQCTVIDKDRSTSTVDGHSKSVFRIYMEGEGCDDTYGLADNWLIGNFNSSDMYAKLKVGKKYEIDTVGIRNGPLSMFKEITTIKEATQ